MLCPVLDETDEGSSGIIVETEASWEHDEPCNAVVDNRRTAPFTARPDCRTHFIYGSTGLQPVTRARLPTPYSARGGSARGNLR